MKVTEKSLKNLVPVTQLSKEEQIQRSRNGGLASAEVRRKRKTLKEELLLLLSEGNIQKEITVALLEKAKLGDIKAFEVVRDTCGQKPKEEVINIETTYEDYIDNKKEEW